MAVAVAWLWRAVGFRTRSGFPPDPQCLDDTVTVLVLGGTAEARTLATLLTERGTQVTSSMAGRVRDPAIPKGDVRVGGFGGVDGLIAFLRHNSVSAVVDATHPFADRMSAHAASAHRRTGVPLLRLHRPGWRDHEFADEWTWVGGYDEARTAAEVLGERPFLSTGRQTLPRFVSWADRYVLVRLVEPPDWEVPKSWEILRSRGPYELEGERELMSAKQIDVLLTKDSGGALTEPKLRAAHSLGVPVVVVSRPLPPGGVPVVTTPQEALDWITDLEVG